MVDVAIDLVARADVDGVAWKAFAEPWKREMIAIITAMKIMIEQQRVA